MSRAAAVEAIRNQARGQARRARNVNKAVVTATSPLKLELLYEDTALGPDDFELSQWVRAYDREIGIEKEDTVLLMRESGEWLVTDIVAEKSVAGIGGGGDSALAAAEVWYAAPEDLQADWELYAPGSLSIVSMGQGLAMANVSIQVKTASYPYTLTDGGLYILPIGTIPAALRTVSGTDNYVTAMAYLNWDAEYAPVPLAMYVVPNGGLNLDSSSLISLPSEIEYLAIWANWVYRTEI